MRTVLLVIAVLAAVIFAGQLPAQIVRLQNKDAVHKDASDRPVGVVQVRVGAANTDQDRHDPDSWVVKHDIPPQVEEIPTFYGEPIATKFLLVLDASESMAGARIASLRAEATSVINDLDKDYEFDCMSYGTQFADSTIELWRALTIATDDNKEQARNFINGPYCNPGSGTPTHRALQKACEIYPANLGKMFLITDGVPNATGSVSQILQHFPTWWAKFPAETALVCVCIGGIGEAMDFMRNLAAEDDSTGVFVNVP